MICFEMHLYTEFKEVLKKKMLEIHQSVYCE